MNQALERFYPENTQPYKDQLRAFRRRHPVMEIINQGARWNYFAGGQGPETILVLHGGGGPAESLFRYIQAFEADYRVVAPTVPADVHTVAGILNAVLAILERENITHVHIFGVSNGGMIGQCLLHQHPDRVSSLVLFHSMLPSPDYARLFARRARMMARIPQWMIQWAGLRWLKKQLQAEAVLASPGELEFWLAYFTELYASDLMTREYFVSRARILTDYFKSYHFIRDDLENWAGRILIIESESDQVVSAGERQRLKQHYSSATVHTFGSAGHLGGGLFKVEETVQMVKEFLMEQRSKDWQ
jgi:pimeloyl-ACP methyl ester carboxylesterase